MALLGPSLTLCRCLTVIKLMACGGSKNEKRYGAEKACNSPSRAAGVQLETCLKMCFGVRLNWLQVKRADFAEIFSGNQQLQGWQPAAACYCGHQVSLVQSQDFQV